MKSAMQTVRLQVLCVALLCSNGTKLELPSLEGNLAYRWNIKVRISPQVGNAVQILIITRLGGQEWQEIKSSSGPILTPKSRLPD